MGQIKYQTTAGVTIYTTTEVTATTLPIKANAGEAYRTMARIVFPTQPGNILDISGRMRVTNDTGPAEYEVGIGYHHWMYDADDGLLVHPWIRIGPYNGDNVAPAPERHHMPMHLEDVYQVPSTWIPGHNIVIVFRADAHSTGYNLNSGTDKITVDTGYGMMTVREYVPLNG